MSQKSRAKRRPHPKRVVTKPSRHNPNKKKETALVRFTRKSLKREAIPPNCSSDNLEII
ncbi:hypothetical protein RP20_CCG001035 [Aedes albopictus]|nr:hypothetical protein RP20_CCG001035 [Aedes albopictus]